jgi:hypothetical protein
MKGTFNFICQMNQEPKPFNRLIKLGQQYQDHGSNFYLECQRYQSEAQEGLSTAPVLLPEVHPSQMSLIVPESHCC